MFVELKFEGRRFVVGLLLGKKYLCAVALYDQNTCATSGFLSTFAGSPTQASSLMETSMEITW